MASASAPTAEDFEGYIRFRILDSIACPGNYKKFLIARKEQEAPWALAMWAQIHTIQTALQELENKEQELRTSALHPMQNLIQHVIESNLPPSDPQLTIATCLISRKTGVPCVVIRGKGRGSMPFHVSSRFVPFLYDLWIIHKMDLLIKTFTRQSLDVFDSDGKHTMAEIAAIFEEARRDDVRALARFFCVAYQHVFRSIHTALQTVV
jgi:hypothetical protein